MTYYAEQAISRFEEEILATRAGPRYSESVLDIGSGDGRHSNMFSKMGFVPVTCELSRGCDFEKPVPGQRDLYRGIWCSHALEHMLDPHSALRRMFQLLKYQGVLAITVPPSKEKIVGGHVSLWNAGLLLYRLILASFDCRHARVGTYGYNISVIVRKQPIKNMPTLKRDNGDINKLAPFFPCEVGEGFDGRLPNIRW